MKRTLLVLLLCTLLPLASGCSGGQEIEDCLFVISMAVDPAKDGNLTVTVKALSGTQEAAQPPQRESPGEEADANPGETTEKGYVVLSATADSCLSALSLLGATTPRTVNLSQLQEIVLSQSIAETDATLHILREIHSLYEANSSAIVVITPDNAGDLIRRQYAMFGVRLSQYLQVLFEHFEKLGTIPPGASLSSVISAMESSVTDAVAVYAAANSFDAPLALGGESVTDRLPGHLPRTSPAQNEYLGSAVFCGPRMVGTLTGDETIMLRLLKGEAQATFFVLDGAMVQVKSRARVRRFLSEENGQTVLGVSIRMNLVRAAGEMRLTPGELAARMETSAAALISRLQAMGSDAVGFGALAVRRFADIPAWTAYPWASRYSGARVQAAAKIQMD